MLINYGLIERRPNYSAISNKTIIEAIYLSCIIFNFDYAPNFSAMNNTVEQGMSKARHIYFSITKEDYTDDYFLN